MDCSNRENDFEVWLGENHLEMNDDGSIVEIPYCSDDE